MLPNMAITVFEGHLVVSTHVELRRGPGSRVRKSPNLAATDDFKRVHAAGSSGLQSGHDSFRFFTRTDESYRGTYELIKQGKLPESETMLARILNAMLGPTEEGGVRKQEIDGTKLPDFDAGEEVPWPRRRLRPVGRRGWRMVGCLLKKRSSHRRRQTCLRAATDPDLRFSEAGCLRLWNSQALLQETRLDGPQVVGVVLLGEAVAFVVGEDGPDGAALAADLGGDLLGLAERHARVVPAVGDEQRRDDLVGVIGRADPLEDGPHLRVALVAVFGPPQIDAIGRRVRQERVEVADADVVDRPP